jgi:hypothetical protein
VRYTEIIPAGEADKKVVEEAQRPLVPEIIRHLVGEFHEAPYDINNGHCEEFGEQLANVLGASADIIWADNLSKPIHEGSIDREWDVKLITLHWPQTYPTHGLTWEDVRYQIPAHCWVIFNDLHYDAECPEGVYNFFQLPLIDRGLARIAARKAKKKNPVSN